MRLIRKIMDVKYNGCSTNKMTQRQLDILVRCNVIDEVRENMALIKKTLKNGVVNNETMKL